MQYKDLNLKAIRESNNLDFAHFTYQRGMCSCCYGPKDLPKKYWKNGIIPEHDDYTYLLFKNADNGSGHVKRDDDIDDSTYIEWDFPEEKLESVCRDLQKQFGDEYIVLVPKSISFCIAVYKANSERIEKELESGNYYILDK